MSRYFVFDGKRTLKGGSDRNIRKNTVSGCTERDWSDLKTAEIQLCFENKARLQDEQNIYFHVSSSAVV